MLVDSERKGCAGMLASLVLSAVAVWAVAELVPGVAIGRFFPDAVVAAIVIGALNALVRPLLVLLTLPITLLTLGVFLIVVNAAVLGLAAWLLPSFTIAGLGPAVVATLVLSFVSWFLEALFGGRARASRRKRTEAESRRDDD